MKMRLYLKVFLLFSVMILAVVIFSFFLVYNFPYNPLFQKLSSYFERESNVSMEVASIKYHFPNIWYIKGMKIYLPEGVGKIYLPDLKLQAEIFNLSKNKKINLLAENTKISGPPADATLREIKLSSSFKLSSIRNNPISSIKNFNFSVIGGNIKSIEYAGLKIYNFNISNILVELLNKNEKFNIKRGVLKSDIFKGSLEGYLSNRDIELSLDLIPSNDFFKRYPDLKPLLGSIIGKNGVTLDVKGSIKSPSVNFLKK